MDDKFKISNRPPVYETIWSRSFSFQNDTTSMNHVLMDGSLYFALNNPTVTSTYGIQYSPTTTYGIQCSSSNMFFYTNGEGELNNRR